MNHYNERSESALIGCLLLSGDDCWLSISDTLSPEMIYSRDHRMVFQAAGYLARTGRYPKDGAEWAAALGQIDARILNPKKYPRGSVLEILGGFEGLLKLTEGAASKVGIEGVAKLLRDDWRRRSMVAAATQVQELLAKPGCDPSEALAILERAHALSDQSESLTMEDAWELAKHGHQLSGARWGIEQLDQRSPMVCGGTYVLSAPPGGGKTAMAMQALHETAPHHQGSIISVEMTPANLGQRAREYFAEKPDFLGQIEVIQGIGVTVENIGSIIAKRGRMGCRLVVVDYLQLLASRNVSATLYERVSRASGEISRAAKASGVTVIELAQMNRDERKTGQRPTMGGLKGAGEIEQDADWVGFIWKDPECTVDEDSPVYPMLLSVDKDRHFGKVGNKPLMWNRPQFKFTAAPTSTDQPEAPQKRSRYDDEPSDEEDLFG